MGGRTAREVGSVWQGWVGMGEIGGEEGVDRAGQVRVRQGVTEWNEEEGEEEEWEEP